MKIKLDENIPGGAADVLHARQRDFDTVVDEALGGQSDPTVPEAAGIEGRIMITLDRGFGDVRPTRQGRIQASLCCDRTINDLDGHQHHRVTARPSRP